MRKRTALAIAGCLVLAVGVVLLAVSVGKREKGSRQLELSYLRVVVPNDLLDVAHLDVGSAKSVTIGNSGTERFLGLRLFRGQNKHHGGIRAEISVDYPFRPGDRVRYTWRMRLADDFLTDAPSNRWWLIGQWHDQPDPRRGESWDGFPSRSPPVLLSLGELDGRLGIGLSYGPTVNKQPQQNLGALWIERGRWYQITADIAWSRGPDGFARVRIDDNLSTALEAHGPNMNNDYQHYWKVGQYRHPAIKTDNVLYLADLHAGPLLPESTLPNARPSTAAEGGAE